MHCCVAMTEDHVPGGKGQGSAARGQQLCWTAAARVVPTPLSSQGPRPLLSACQPC